MSGSGPTPSQRIRGAVNGELPNGDHKILPPGAYVRVVRWDYLPTNHPFANRDRTYLVPALTQFGFMLLPRGDIDWHVV